MHFVSIISDELDHERYDSSLASSLALHVNSFGNLRCVRSLANLNLSFKALYHIRVTTLHQKVLRPLRETNAAGFSGPDRMVLIHCYPIVVEVSRLPVDWLMFLFMKFRNFAVNLLALKVVDEEGTEPFFAVLLAMNAHDSVLLRCRLQPVLRMPTDKARVHAIPPFMLILGADSRLLLPSSDFLPKVCAHFLGRTEDVSLSNLSVNLAIDPPILPLRNGDSRVVAHTLMLSICLASGDRC